MALRNAVGAGFENGKRFDVGVLLRRVGTSRRKLHGYVASRIFRCFLDRGGTAENDNVCERNIFARRIEFASYIFERFEHFGEFGGLIDGPILLRLQTNARAVGTAAHIGTAERGSRSPRRRNELRNGQTAIEDSLLEVGDALSIDRRGAAGRDGILPKLLFGRHFRSEIPRDRAHIAVRQFVPRLGKCFGELLRIFVEALGDRRENRVDLSSAKSVVNMQSASASLPRRARRERYSPQRRPSASTENRRPGSSTTPIRSRTSLRRNRCPT